MTIAMLSWGSEKTLRNTLHSYSYYGLFPTDEQKIIVLQEGTPHQEMWMRSYGFEPISLPHNVGIARAYRILLERADEPDFLFLENDWELLTSPNNQLQIARSYDADVFRLRHRDNPGSPLWSRQFIGNEYSRPEYLLDSVHWRERPDLDFPEVISSTVKEFTLAPYYSVEDIKEVRIFRTTSEYANWTNNPHLAKTDFLRYNIAPQIGDGDIERDMQEWWRNQEFTVAQSDGLFTHNRLD